MFRKGLIYMVSLFVLCGGLFGCSKSDTTDVSTSSNNEVTTFLPQTEPVETTEPDDGSLKFFYDDRISPEDLGGTADSLIEISQQQIESVKVGTSEPDDSLLVFDDEEGVYIAAGVGTATVLLDGREVLVRVKPAPISLFMITGHSIGAGQKGVAAQSVVSEAGQVYSCHKASTFQSADPKTGLGHFAEIRPDGIDAFSPNGGGTIGEGSGLAWKWNHLTEEKVWILNAAVGGSVIPEWQKGGKFYDPAVAMYRAAALVLKNEIAAGHYLLKNTAIIYHSAANFEYKNVEYDDQVLEFWYDSMYSGFMKDLSMDITGDGVDETVQAIGFLPIWKTAEKGYYPFDKAINYYMAISDAYPGCFIAGETMRNWYSDTLLAENFPNIEYSTQSEPVSMPISIEELIAEDGVHYSQVAYNAAGLEIADNLYRYFRTKQMPDEFYIYTSSGKRVDDSLTFKRVGSSHSLIIETSPITVSDFTIEVSDNLQLSSPFNLKATAEGDGFIRLLYEGKEILNIKVTVGK